MDPENGKWKTGKAEFLKLLPLSVSSRIQDARVVFR